MDNQETLVAFGTQVTETKINKTNTQYSQHRKLARRAIRTPEVNQGAINGSAVPSFIGHLS
jgi:hypothetical protein